MTTADEPGQAEADILIGIKVHTLSVCVSVCYVGP